LDKTYEILIDPPPPMSWEDYERHVIFEWSNLLNSGNNSDETSLHNFLEKHPCLLPGAFYPQPSGHFPFPGAVISKPPLTGLGKKIPDFMWITSDSGHIYPVLVEIETPAKRWFTNKGVPHSKLTQALDQLTEWKTWFNTTENQALFNKLFQIPDVWLRYRTFHPYYILIYGNRNEFKDNPFISKKRAQLARSDEFHMTFDRLIPLNQSQQFICVSIKCNYYNALSIPPTLKLGPNLADYRSIIKNKESAVIKNDLITRERKEFLLKRIPYWDKWAQSDMKGVIQTSDEE
jgi:hypothetical protein